MTQTESSLHLVTAPSSSVGYVISSTAENNTSNRNKRSSSTLLFDDKNESLNLDGALYKILEFLTPSDFYTLGALSGSRFWKRFLFDNPQSEYLFSSPGHPEMTKGRTRLKNLYYFRKLVERIPRGKKKWKKRNRKGSTLVQYQQNEERQSLNRVGVFSAQEEDSILVDDTNGYFGVCFFRTGVLGVWGDYSGIFLTPHVDKLFLSRKNSELKPDEQLQIMNSSETIEEETKSMEEVEEEERDSDKTKVRAHDRKTMGTEGSGYLFTDSYQVMAILSDCKPYVFLGFASGAIHSIHTRPYYKDQSTTSISTDLASTKSGKTIEYLHVSKCRYHCQRGEISSLASVADRHIVSSSMRVNAIESEILIHWNALKDGNIQRISRIKIDAEIYQVRGPRIHDEIWDVTPLDMASSSFLPKWNGPVLSIGARGQNLTHICLWSNTNSPDGNNTMSETFASENNLDNPPPLFTPSKSFRNCIFRDEYRAYRTRRSRDRRSHHFVFLKYFQKNKLIVGTSRGDILRIEMDKRYLSSKRGNPYILYNCCRGGMVEAVELVGNKKPIMITGGGYDGMVQFWDWESFHSLGSLRIHPGQQVLAAETSLASRSTGTSKAVPMAHHRYSPVVSTFFCHERSSLVSFCRDGHLHEWKVEEEANKQKTSNANSTNSKSAGDTMSFDDNGVDYCKERQYCFPRAHR